MSVVKLRSNGGCSASWEFSATQIVPFAQGCVRCRRKQLAAGLARRS